MSNKCVKIKMTVDGEPHDVLSATTTEEIKNALGYTPAKLDESGKIPSTQLPSDIDDIIEGYLYNNSFFEDEQYSIPIAEQSGKIYVDILTDILYRWDGTSYVLTSKKSEAWTESRFINGLLIDGTSDVSNYCECTTATDTIGKVVSCINFRLDVGAEVIVKFVQGNTAENITLNVNNTGDISIYYNGSPIGTDVILENSVHTFIYDGTTWNKVGCVASGSSGGGGSSTITYGTEELIAGESELPTGHVYLVYEE